MEAASSFRKFGIVIRTSFGSWWTIHCREVVFQIWPKPGRKLSIPSFRALKPLKFPDSDEENLGKATVAWKTPIENKEIFFS